jgi:hypothetical protein
LAEVEQARLQKPRAEKVFSYFIADDHQIAILALTRIAKYGAPSAPVPRAVGTDLSGSRFLVMSKDDDLKKQAERAEAIAEQTVDESLKQILLNAAKDYRKKAKEKD